MLLGLWRSIDELEDNISLQELQAILEAQREKELGNRRFMAALKGIDIDAGSAADAKERVEEMKRKAEAMQSGISEDEFEFSDLGIAFDTDDED